MSVARTLFRVHEHSPYNFNSKQGVIKMRRPVIAGLAVALFITFYTTAATYAASDPKANDTDTRMISARVVEVADGHISVIARSGVEHVIAIDQAGTKVTIGGRAVSLKDVREGDLINIELDAHKQVKFAKNISIGAEQIQLARNRR